MEPPHQPHAGSNNLRSQINSDPNISIQMKGRNITDRISNVFGRSNKPLNESESNQNSEDDKLKYRSFDHGKVNTVLSEYLFKENVKKIPAHEMD